MDLSDQRMNYEVDGIDLGAMSSDPIAQFEAWFGDAQEAGDPEPYAMVLSTVDHDGQPRGRTVLLRGIDVRGFTFYTNYTSAKAEALDSNGRAGLTFHWHGLHRQVHVEGTVDRIPEAESDDYFAKRPRASQLGAWASNQSSAISSRGELLDQLASVSEQFDGRDVERPPHWGGYRVHPKRIEFWQGQPSRLHDRVEYQRSADGWTRGLLSP